MTTASELACFNDNGAGTGGVADDGIKNGDEPVVSSTNGSVSVATGDDIVCTFTNTRDEGSIELHKVLVGTAGNVTVSIDQGDTDIDSAVADGERQHRRQHGRHRRLLGVGDLHPGRFGR